MELLIIIPWLVLCGAAAVYASRKGRSGVGIFFVSLLLSPVVGFVVAFVMESHRHEQPKAQSEATSAFKFDPDVVTKKCPDCAEIIKVEAIVCRFCGRKFEALDVQTAIEEARSTFDSRPVKWWN